VLHTFNIVSVNLARQLGDAVSLEAFITEMELCMQNWSVMFLAESDFHLTADFVPDSDYLQRAQHRYYRHWPGQGSIPFSILVHRSWAPFLRHVEFKGRACRLDFRQSRMITWSTLFLHMTPGDDGFSDAFHEDMFDVAYLANSRPKRSLLVMAGDFNVDLLPTMVSDPFRDLPGRASRHEE